MFIKNVSSHDILDYNCGYGNIVTLKKGQVIEVLNEKAAKNLIRLLSPYVEETQEKPKPVKKVKVSNKKPESVKKVKVSKKK